MGPPSGAKNSFKIYHYRIGIPALLKCHTRLTHMRLNPYDNKLWRISNFPVPLGMHLLTRRKQLEFNMTFCARNLNISPATYRAWEADQVAPTIKRIPSIIRFLTYCPYDPGLSFGDKLVLSRSVNGLSQKELAALTDLDQSTLARWERCDSTPYPILMPRIFTAQILLGDLGLKLFTDEVSPTNNVYQHISQSLRPVSEKKSVRIPKLQVGTIEIHFPPSLFVLYDGRWPIAKKLRAWRACLGLSQRDFAKLVGFTSTTICYWENGRRLPSAEHLARITAVLSKILRYLESPPV